MSQRIRYNFGGINLPVDCTNSVVDFVLALLIVGRVETIATATVTIAVHWTRESSMVVM